MCPCPICMTIVLILAPFFGFKWAKKKLEKHHCHCKACQEAEQSHMKKCAQK